MSGFPTIGSLSNHDDDGNKNPTNLHIWQWKTVFLHALHVHISSFDILKTFSFFLRREICVDDVSIGWQMFNFVLLSQKRWFQFNSRIVRTHFASAMTLNNCDIIEERRSYIFSWRSRGRRSRLCLSSLMMSDETSSVSKLKMSCCCLLFCFETTFFPLI